MAADPSRAGARRLPASAATWLTPLMLSLVMTFVVSLVSTLVGVGWTAATLSTWLRAWGISWAIAFPTLLVMLPLVRKATAALVAQP